jgi:hypothetical protein
MENPLSQSLDSGKVHGLDGIFDRLCALEFVRDILRAGIQGRRPLFSSAQKAIERLHGAQKSLSERLIATTQFQGGSFDCRFEVFVNQFPESFSRNGVLK